MQEMLEKIVELIRSRSIILFVGAGMSKSSGLPTANGLRDVLAEQYFNNSEPYSSMPLDNLVDNIIFKGSQFNENRVELLDFLKPIFILDSSHLSVPHSQIAQIPYIEEVFTTNYDNLFELAYGGNFNAVYNNDTFSKQFPQRPTIYKVHGDFNDYSSIVLSKSDYSNKLAEISSNSSLLFNYLRAIIGHKVFLFIGFSLEDLDITSTIDSVLNLRTTQTKSYFISPEINDIQRNRLRSRNIIGIPATGDEIISKIHTRLLERLNEDLENGILCDVKDVRFANANGYGYRIEYHNRPVSGLAPVPFASEKMLTDAEVNAIISNEQFVWMQHQLYGHEVSNKNKTQILSAFLSEADRQLQNNVRFGAMPFLSTAPRKHSESSNIRLNQNIIPLSERITIQEFWENEFSIYEINSDYFTFNIIFYDNHVIHTAFSYINTSALVHERLMCFEKIKKIIKANIIEVFIPWEKRYMTIYDSSWSEAIKDNMEKWIELTDIWSIQMEKLSRIQEHFQIIFQLPLYPYVLTESDAVAIEIIYDSIIGKTTGKMGNIYCEMKELRNKVNVPSETSLGFGFSEIQPLLLFGYKFICEELFIMPCVLIYKSKTKFWSTKNGNIPVRHSFKCEECIPDND